MDETTTRAHGGPRSGELEGLGLAGSAVLDFSVNINPYGPCPEVADAIRAAPLGEYPDPEARAARGALAALWRVTDQEITLGNGASPLLWSLTQVLARAGEPVVVAGPTFSEMSTAARQLGATLVEIRARPEAAFALDAERLSRTIVRVDARAVYLCAPNNPTGTPLSQERVAQLAARHPTVTFVIDQAFLSLSDQHDELWAPRPRNVALVRSLTKDHAIPGLRLGALIADAALIRRVNDARPTWDTGTLVQAAAVAVASPAAQAFVTTTRARMLADRAHLEKELRARGYQTFPSSTTFFLVEVGDAALLRSRLLHRHQILVRDCTSFELPHIIRLGARPAAARGRFLQAWDAIRDGG